mgnify:CR=1 FL=1
MSEDHDKEHKDNVDLCDSEREGSKQPTATKPLNHIAVAAMSVALAAFALALGMAFKAVILDDLPRLKKDQVVAVKGTGSYRLRDMEALERYAALRLIGSPVRSPEECARVVDKQNRGKKNPPSAIAVLYECRQLLRSIRQGAETSLVEALWLEGELRRRGLYDPADITREGALIAAQNGARLRDINSYPRAQGLLIYLQALRSEVIAKILKADNIKPSRAEVERAAKRLAKEGNYVAVRLKDGRRFTATRRELGRLRKGSPFAGSRVVAIRPTRPSRARLLAEAAAQLRQERQAAIVQRYANTLRKYWRKRTACRFRIKDICGN